MLSTAKEFTLDKAVGHRTVKLHTQRFKLVLIALDLAVINLLYVGLIMLRLMFPGGSGFQEYNPLVLFFIAFGSVASVYIAGGYNRATDMISFRFAAEHVMAALIGGMVVLLAVYLFATYEFQIKPGRFAIIGTLGIFPFISIAYRRTIFNRLNRTIQNYVLLVLGSLNSCRNFYQYHRFSKRYQNVYFFATNPADPGKPVDPGSEGSPLMRRDIKQGVREFANMIETIVVTEDTERLPTPLLDFLVSLQIQQHNVKTLQAYARQQWRMVPAMEVDLGWILEDTGFSLSQNLTFERMKRLMDIIGASTVLLLTWPLILLASIAIKLDSTGPVIFRQSRVGLHNNSFTIFKLRTMACGSESGDKYTRRGDSRITRIGRFLRLIRIDELPQLWNVLRGEMSFIGPRAEWTELVKDYEQKIPNYHFRHLVKPGLTGWAQVNYPYGENIQDTIKKLNYDLYYVKHYSFKLDFEILLKTCYMVFGGKGQ